MTDELQAAIAEVQRVTRIDDEAGQGSEWRGAMFCDERQMDDGGPEPIDHAIATILNAVVSGALVPAPAVPDDVASLSAAREAAAVERAFRDGLAYATNVRVKDHDQAWQQSLARERLGTTAALNRLIAERVREAFEKLAQEIEAEEREAATWGGPDPRGPHEAQINLRFARMLRARGSKEGR